MLCVSTMIIKTLNALLSSQMLRPFHAKQGGCDSAGHLESRTICLIVCVPCLLSKTHFLLAEDKTPTTQQSTDATVRAISQAFRSTSENVFIVLPLHPIQIQFNCIIILRSSCGFQGSLNFFFIQINAPFVYLFISFLLPHLSLLISQTFGSDYAY